MDRAQAKQRIAQLSRIPSNPELLHEIRSRLQRGPFLIGEIEEIVIRDPAVAIQLLAAAVAGSPHTGNTLRSALDALGESGLRLVISQVSEGLENGGLFFPSREAMCDMAFATACSARSLARRMQHADESEMFLAGLLHNVGKWVLAALDLQKFVRCQSAGGPDSIESLDAETRAFGFHHGEAGKWYAESLRLPHWLIDTIWLHHISPSALSPDCFPAVPIAVTKLAGLVAQHIRSSEEAARIPEAWRSLADYIDLDPSLLPDAVREAERDMERLARRTSDTAPDRDAESALDVHDGPEDTPAAMSKMRLRIQRLEALQRAILDLHSGEPLPAIVRLCAKTLRQGLSVAPGVCYATDTGGQKLWGTTWRTVSDSLADFSVDLHEAAVGDHDVPTPILRAVRELGMAKIEGEWNTRRGEPTSRRDGLMVVPLGCGGQSFGQIIVDASATDFGISETDLADLLVYARGLGAVVAQWHALDRAALRTEELARSLRSSDAATPSAEKQTEVAPSAADAAAFRERFSRFTGAVARTLDGPLGLISSQAQRMLAKTKDIESHRALDTIVRESRRLNRFRTDLAALAPQTKTRLEPCLINFRIHQFVAAMKSRFERRGIQIKEMYAEGLHRVMLDPRRLEHVFLNLFTLAEDAMDETGGTITIQTGSTSDRQSVIVQFTHNGRGISATPSGDVFEPFNEHGATTSGIALAVCRSILDDHGGRISLDRGPEGGDTFTLVLPPATLDQRSAEPETSIADTSAALQTVLVVDDDEAVREILRQTLQMRGYHVLTAVDGIQAQTVIAATKLDVIILDLLMPNRNGLAVLRDLSVRPDAPPVVFMTGNASPQVREEALSLGARSFLLKPFELRELLEELDALLAPQV